MRIVGGEFRGRTLVGPSLDETRPTTDRTRESLFNILQNKLDFVGLNVLDLFAGTGALGLEAVSRGAKFATFVENSRRAGKVILQNIDQFGVNDRTKLLSADATDFSLNNELPQFDLIFADPPYTNNLGQLAASNLMKNDLLSQGALFVLEEKNSHLPQSLQGFEKQDERKFGNTVIGFFRVI